MSQSFNLVGLRMALSLVLGMLLVSLVLPSGFERHPLTEPDAQGHRVVEQRNFWLGNALVVSQQHHYNAERQRVESSAYSLSPGVPNRLLPHLAMIVLVALLLYWLPARWVPPEGVHRLFDGAKLSLALLANGAAAALLVFALFTLVGPRPVEYEWVLAEPERLEQVEQALTQHLNQTGRRGQVERAQTRNGQPLLRLTETRIGLIGSMRLADSPLALQEATGPSQLSVTSPLPRWLLWLTGVVGLLAMLIQYRKASQLAAER